jgi:hypothetical protein
MRIANCGFGGWCRIPDFGGGDAAGTGRRGRLPHVGTGRTEALEDAALIVELGGDDAAGHLEAERGIQGALVLAQPGQAVGVVGGEKSAQKLAAPTEDAHGYAGAQQGGEGLGSDLHRLGNDEAVQVADGNLAQDLVAVSRFVAPEDFKTLAVEGNPATVLVNGGGRHLNCGLRSAECGVTRRSNRSLR